MIDNLGDHRSRFIQAIELLFNLRGTNSSLEFVLDDRKELIHRLLSATSGKLIYLFLLIIRRRYSVCYIKGTNCPKKGLAVTNDRLVADNKFNLVSKLKQIIFVVQLLYKYRQWRKEKCNKITEKFLFANFIWYYSSAKINWHKFDQRGEVILNADFSPIDAAIFALQPDNSNITILIPAFTKFSDHYYKILASACSKFRMQRATDYMPKEFINNFKVSTCKYLVPEYKKDSGSKKELLVILTTFKGHEADREKTIVNAVATLKKILGEEWVIKIRPHPYEYNLIKRNKVVNKNRINITLDDEDLSRANVFLIAGSSILFELIHYGRPIVFIEELDKYFPHTYAIFSSQNILRLNLCDLRDIQSIFQYYQIDQRWARLCTEVLGSVQT